MSARAHESELRPVALSPISLHRIASWRGIRVLAWDGDVLYGCRGYELVSLQSTHLQHSENAAWGTVARYSPDWWRSLTSRSRLTYRLVRDGFHAHTALDDGTMIAAVPGAIITRSPESNQFQTTHRIFRGTRPLHITAVPSGNIYWGEYFDNAERAEVHVYASSDRGRTWWVAYNFPAGTIRHIHNIVYDRWADCLWILTGDEGAECKILRASCDLRSIETVLSGNQQARAVAAIPTQDGLYLSTDTPLERNHVLRLDRAGRVEIIADLSSSSIFGCRAANVLFFSTMVEPSEVNPTKEVLIAGSADGKSWQTLARWEKDSLPMRYFQFGNAILPDGDNPTNYLAATTIAVKHDDLVTTVWGVGSCPSENQPACKSTKGPSA